MIPNKTAFISLSTLACQASITPEVHGSVPVIQVIKGRVHVFFRKQVLSGDIRYECIKNALTDAAQRQKSRLRHPLQEDAVPYVSFSKLEGRRMQMKIKLVRVTAEDTKTPQPTFPSCTFVFSTEDLHMPETLNYVGDGTWQRAA